MLIGLVILVIIVVAAIWCADDPVEYERGEFSDGRDAQSNVR